MNVWQSSDRRAQQKPPHLMRMGSNKAGGGCQKSDQVIKMMKSLQWLFWASFHPESPRRRKAAPFVDRGGRVYARRQPCKPRALLRVFVCAPGVFPVSAYTEQPVEASSDETPTLCPHTEGSTYYHSPAHTPFRLMVNHASDRS